MSLLRYVNDLFSSLGSLLGRSSLLNVPRAPLEVGSSVSSYAFDTVQYSFKIIKVFIKTPKKFELSFGRSDFHER